MNEMDKLRFNYTTMPRRKEYNLSRYSEDVVVRPASVKNEFGWHDFLFVYGYHYGEHKPAIRVHYVDSENNVRTGSIFSDHPDFDFLEAYITEI